MNNDIGFIFAIIGLSIAIFTLGFDIGSRRRSKNENKQ